MVPPKAQATVLGLSLDTVEAAIRDLALEEAISFSCQEKGPGVHILCSGQNAHGSTPEEGHNAQTALVALLAALPLADCPSTRALRALHALFPHGDHHGQALGIAQADDLSGPLTLAFTMLTLHDTGCQHPAVWNRGDHLPPGASCPDPGRVHCPGSSGPAPPCSRRLSLPPGPGQVL